MTRTYHPVTIIARHEAEAGFRKTETILQTKLPRPKETSFHRNIGLTLGGAYIENFRTLEPSARMSFAGSIRRENEIIHDIDILISPPSEKIRTFVSDIGKEVLWNGPEKISILYPWKYDWMAQEEYIQIDFRFIAPSEWAPALQYFTGSAEHNISLRSIAKIRGLHLSEHGLFEKATGKRLDDNTEKSIYQTLGLRWLPPRYRNGPIRGREPIDKNEPKQRCEVCQRPIRVSDMERHLKECHVGFVKP